MSRLAKIDPVIVSKPKTLQNERNGEVKVVEKSRQCPICLVYYKYGNSYWQHVRYVHARVLSQCVICEKSYKRTTMAKHHILHSHKIAWHLCSNYVRKIKKSDLLENKNIQNVMDKKNNKLKYFKKKTLHLISSFNCYDCPESFKTISELFEHVKSHRNDLKNNEIDSEYEKVDSDCEKVDSNFENVESNFEEVNSDYEKIDSNYENIDSSYGKTAPNFEDADLS